MKKNLFTILFSLAVMSASAQHLIKGKVIDDKNQSVISANILLQKKSDKSILQTCITDTTGFFFLSPKKTFQHHIVVSAMGFETAFVDLPDTLTQDTMVLIRLSNQGKQLEQVSIYGKTPLIERKTDRILFNVENSLAAIGGDGIDALSKAPGLRINDNGINIVGKSNVKIMVNDRLIQLSGADLINYVKSIPAANIKRIEIITNPSARYEADGNAGLINIVLKKNMAQGFNGMINTGAILASRYTAGLTGIFNYNIKKLHISSNLTGVRSEIESNGLNRFSTANNLLERQSTNLNKGNGFREDIRLDYDLTANTTVGLKYMGGIRKYTNDLNETGSFYNRTNNILDSTLLNMGKDDSRYTLKNFEFYVDHKIDTMGKRVEFASNYFKYGTNDDNRFQSNSYNSLNALLNAYLPIISSNNENIEIFTNKLDFTMPYKVVNVEFGAKLSNIKSKNSLIYDVNSGASILNNNIFDYKEITQSVYASADKDYKKWSFKLGLRMETTQTTGNSSVQNQEQRNNYFQLFPTFFVKHNVNENHVFSFNYGRRINRPNYSLLNPAKLYSAVNVYEEGNPYLKPSFSNNFELTYNYKDWLSTSVYTNFVSNGFSSLDFFDATNNIQSVVQRNYANSVTMGLSETLTFSLLSWWESNTQFNIYLERSKSNGAITEGTLKQLSGYLSTDNNFVLNKKKTLMLNATFWYQFPEVSNRLITDAYYAADLSFRAMFLERKLTLAVNVSDVFKTSQAKYNGTVNGITQFSTLYRDNRKARIAIVYRFGNSKRNKAQRQTDNDETNRVKQGN